MPRSHDESVAGLFSIEASAVAASPAPSSEREDLSVPFLSTSAELSLLPFHTCIRLQILFSPPQFLFL